MPRMRAWFHPFTLLCLTTALASGPLIEATTLEHFDLGRMVRRAARIFRGTVLEVDTGTVRVGGGELPTITYTIRVGEAFKGAFEEVEGRRIARIRMLGKFAPRRSGTARRLSPLADLPTLTPGSDYLLFVTAPGAIGLSTTLGLAQGRFELVEKPGNDTQAVNGFNNLGLFPSPGIGTFATGGERLPVSGPVSYSLLADRIRAELGREGGGPE